MKKVLLVLALTLVAGQSHASKARVLSLQYAAFLKDSQTIFVNPAHVNSLGKYLTFEFGGSTNTSAPKAEGGLFMEEFGGKAGVYVGHMSPIQSSIRSGAATASELENNPVEMFYAKDDWGMSLGLSNSENKTTDSKQQYLVARYGMARDGMEFAASAELLSTVEAGNDKTTAAPYLTVNFEKEMGTNYLFVNANWGTGKYETLTTSADVKDMGVQVGLLSRKIESIYYGAAISYAKRETTADNTALRLPIFMGIEKDLNSWSVVRASISQGFLLGSTEDKTQAAPANGTITNANDTTVAAGLGIKYNNFILDGLVSAASTGQVNGSNILTQASMTYTF